MIGGNMDNQTMTMPGAGTEPQRVVEYELRRPHREDIKLPVVDVEPFRKALEEIVLTSIGLAIVTGRSLASTIEAAHRAGAEAADNPGPVTRAVLDMIGRKTPAARTPSRTSIPVLPVADYDSLESEQVISRLTSLDREELAAVRVYELEHERRTAILKAIDGLETTAS
jgi:hypothetical protein